MDKNEALINPGLVEDTGETIQGGRKINVRARSARNHCMAQ